MYAYKNETNLRINCMHIHTFTFWKLTFFFLYLFPENWSAWQPDRKYFQGLKDKTETETVRQDKR